MQVRIGKFRVSAPFWDRHWRGVQKEMQAKLLDRFECGRSRDVFVTAESPLFDLVEEGDLIPEYDIFIYTNTHRFGVGVRRIRD